MKKVVLLVLWFNAILLHAQTSGINWSSPINVGVGSSHSNIYPRLTLTNGDIPLVVWEDSSPATIYTSRKTGTSFSTPIAINGGVTPYVVNWTGPEIASKGDTAFVVFMTSITNPKTYVVRTLDGGLTFSDTVRIDNEINRIASFPTVAVMSDGNPIVAYMGSDTLTMMDPKYTVTKSVDGGVSFLPSVEPLLSGEACDCCPSSLVVSENTQALIFRNNISNLREMWASFSTDTCSTFPISSNIDTTNWISTTCPSSAPSGVIIGDSLVYTWMSDGTGDARIYIGSVNVNDQQIGQHRQLYPVGAATQNFPVIAGKGDTLGVVWMGYNAGFQEVLFTYSFSGVAGLGMDVDTITKGLTGNQSRPDIAFNNGKFHIVYSQTIGGQVHYVEGAYVTNLSINEMDPASVLSLSSFNSNNVIEVMINSKAEFKSDISIYNSIGQKMKMSAVELKVGINKHSIEHSLSSGIYFVLVSANDGRVYQNKIIITK